MAQEYGQVQSLRLDDGPPSPIMPKSNDIFGSDDSPRDARGGSASASKRNESTVFSGPLQDEQKIEVICLPSGRLKRVHRQDDRSQATIFGDAPAAEEMSPTKGRAPTDNNIFGGVAVDPAERPPAGGRGGSPVTAKPSGTGGEPYQRGPTTPRLPGGPNTGYMRNQGEFKNPITHVEHDWQGDKSAAKPPTPQKAHFRPTGGYNPITGAAFGDAPVEAAARPRVAHNNNANTKSTALW